MSGHGYFWGCSGRDHPGHYWHQPGMRTVGFDHVPRHIDRTGDAPEFNARDASQPQSAARVAFGRGWASLHIWDRTGDKRFNSVAVYAIQSPEPLDFATLCDLFARDFPATWARINTAAPVYLADPEIGDGDPK